MNRRFGRYGELDPSITAALIQSGTQVLSQATTAIASATAAGQAQQTALAQLRMARASAREAEARAREAAVMPLSQALALRGASFNLQPSGGVPPAGMVEAPSSNTPILVLGVAALGVAAYALMRPGRARRRSASSIRRAPRMRYA